jgi:histidyl-tRNA synthetase
VEAFNVASPHIDAEIITLLAHFLTELGLANVSMNINSLGCPACRPDFKARLQDFLRSKKDELCPDCQRRLETNPLRVLDCKVPRCAELAQDAPSILDSLCPECEAHFQVVRTDLETTGVPFVVNSRLVRGLDYYTRTTFEAQTGDLGAQNAVAGGGRYDGLVRHLGGPDVPGIGFAVGLERLTMLMAAQGTTVSTAPDLFLASLDEPAVDAAFGLVQNLRRNGLAVETDYSAGSLKSRMKRADKSGAGWVVILGPDEISRGQVILRNMRDGEQKEVPFADLTDLAAKLTDMMDKESRS